MEYDIYFYEAFDKEKELLEKQLPEGISAGFFHETIQESGNKEPPAKIISIRTQSRVPISWAGKIKAILSRSSGYDHIEPYKDILPCGYLPEYCSRSVAEHAILLILNLMKKFPRQIKQFTEFGRQNITGNEIKNKTLLVVGVGKIGYEIYKLAKNLDMNVKGVDIDNKHDDVEYVDIEIGLKIADVVVCAMNLTEENSGYFDYDLLKKAKPGVLFINIARGELSPSQDLLKLLEEKHLGGIGLDVYNKEATLGESLRNKIFHKDEEIIAVMELSKKENVILTPHNAFNTNEAVGRKSEQTIQQLKHFIDNEKFLWEIPE